MAELQKKEAPVLVKPSTTAQQKPAPFSQKTTARGRVGAKVDTGLSKIKGPSFGPPPSRTVRGKENMLSATNRPPAAKVMRGSGGINFHWHLVWLFVENLIFFFYEEIIVQVQWKPIFDEN
jgi:hypothetical protein